MSNDNIFNNAKVIQVGPNEVQQIFNEQVGFFKSKEFRDPNCCMMGRAIIEIVNSVSGFERDEKIGETTYGGLKVYMDDDNPAAICVGYNPFLMKQGLIL